MTLVRTSLLIRIVVHPSLRAYSNGRDLGRHCGAARGPNSPAVTPDAVQPRWRGGPPRKVCLTNSGDAARKDFAHRRSGELRALTYVKDTKAEVSDRGLGADLPTASIPRRRLRRSYLRTWQYPVSSGWRGFR